MKQILCLREENRFGMNYLAFHPDDCRELPLLIYLHGAGERGTNPEHVFRHAVPKLIRQGKEYPAVVLCPQCPAEYVWDNVVRELKAMIDKVAADFSILPDRICITGSSMGGFGTWMMGLTYSGFFSAIAPVAGGGMAWRVTNLVNTPVYAVHGLQDDAVLPVHSQMMCDRLRRNGGSAKLVLLEGKGHNDGIDCAYEEMDMVDWLLQQRKRDLPPIPEALSDLF